MATKCPWLSKRRRHKTKRIACAFLWNTCRKIILRKQKLIWSDTKWRRLSPINLTDNEDWQARPRPVPPRKGKVKFWMTNEERIKQHYIHYSTSFFIQNRTKAFSCVPPVFTSLQSFIFYNDIHTHNRAPIIVDKVCR